MIVTITFFSRHEQKCSASMNFVLNHPQMLYLIMCGMNYRRVFLVVESVDTRALADYPEGQGD